MNTIPVYYAEILHPAMLLNNRLFEHVSNIDSHESNAEGHLIQVAYTLSMIDSVFHGVGCCYRKKNE